MLPAPRRRRPWLRCHPGGCRQPGDRVEPTRPSGLWRFVIISEIWNDYIQKRPPKCFVWSFWKALCLGFTSNGSRGACYPHLKLYNLISGTPSESILEHVLQALVLLRPTKQLNSSELHRCQLGSCDSAQDSKALRPFPPLLSKGHQHWLVPDFPQHHDGRSGHLEGWPKKPGWMRSFQPGTLNLVEWSYKVWLPCKLGPNLQIVTLLHFPTFSMVVFWVTPAFSAALAGDSGEG